jgi:mutator protein MutT
MFAIGTFGIILDEKDRVLLCHRRDYDFWNLPGGRLEKGENPWDAVIREIREETGLEAKIVRLSGIYSRPEKNEIVFSFICKRIGGEMILTDEADKIEYFELENIPRNTAPKQVERIRDYFSNKDKVHYKIQIGPSSIDLIKAGKL